MTKHSKTILISSNCAWSIYNFRLPLVRMLREEGFKVVVVTQFDGHQIKLEKEVDGMYDLYISRKGINPIKDLITFLHLLLVQYRSKVDLCLFFTIKPVIYGSLGSMLLRKPAIPMITGLGTAFIEDNWITVVVRRLYRLALSSVSTIFFQNTDDRALFVATGLVNPNVCQLTPGSGVDLDRFIPAIMPAGDKITFLLIARMLKDKGIREFVEAAMLVRAKIPKARFQLLGALGVENRSAISHGQMDEWEKQGIVSYLGETDDVIPYIEQANCIVLPSYREGTSRVLLEAAAMARPIIATDVPGCREVVDVGENGLLCRVKDVANLAEKMIEIASLSTSDLEVMGARGRLKVAKEFDQDSVSLLYINAINAALFKAG